MSHFYCNLRKNKTAKGHKRRQLTPAQSRKPVPQGDGEAAALAGANQDVSPLALKFADGLEVKRLRGTFYGAVKGCPEGLALLFFTDRVAA